MRLRGKFLVATLVCLLATGTIMAQSNYGGIQGEVVDDAGQPLPGVTVLVSSPSLQGTRTSTTENNGKFRFMLLDPGTYRAVFSMPGFQRLEQENIQVSLENTITLDVSLTSTFTEEVMVTSEAPVIDITSTTVGSNLGEQVLNDVPVGRDFTAVTFLATGAVDGGGIANDAIGANPSIMGASALENRYVVNQLDTTDAAEGRAGTRVSTSFVEEVQVKTAGYEAEYGGALGGVINMITKSGGNELHGDVFGYFSNDSLWDDAEIPASRQEVVTVDQEYDIGFTIGGKLIEDRLWYFLGYNPNTLDQNIYNEIRNGETLIQTNAFIRGYERDYFSAKLTFQANDANSIGMTVIGDPTTISNQYYTANYVDSPYVDETDMFSNVDEGGINYGLGWNSILGENAFFELNVGHHENSQEYMPNLNAINYQDQTADGFWTRFADSQAQFGGNGFRQPVDDRTRDQIRASFTWFLGDSHEIKLGAGYNAVEYDMDYNVNGPSAAFCSPALSIDEPNPWFGDIGLNGPVAFDHDTGSYYTIPFDCDTDGDSILDGVMMPARVGNRYRLRGSYYYNRNYKNQSNGDTNEYNVYGQDSWRLADNLTLSVGLRAESSLSEGNLTTIMPERKVDFSFNDMIAPRLGLVWDPTDTGRAKVFAHYGKFYQSIPLTLNVRSLGNEQYDFIYYRYPENTDVPSPTNAGALFYYVSSRSEYTVIDPDIKPQYLEEYVLGGEYEVMTDLALGVKYIRRELGRVIEDISVDGGNTYFVTNPGGTFTTNPGTGGTPIPAVDFPEAVRDFEGIEISMVKRFSNNWQAYSSLLWSQLEGNYEGLYSRDNRQIDPNITSKFDLPDLLLNAYGMLQNDREWQFKAYGSYHFDFGLVTGLNMHFLTGNPISKLGAHAVYGLDERFVTPRGTEGRTEDWLNFDLHLSYPFNLGDYRLEAMLDIFNFFDEQVAVEVDNRWTVYGPGDEEDAPEGDINAQTNDTWGMPLVYSPPRNIRFGLKFSW